MNYINTTTLEYPVTETQIRAEHLNVAFPAQFLPPLPYAAVFPSPAPTHDATQYTAIAGAPVLTAKGHWESTWELQELSDDAVIALMQARAVSEAAAKRASRESRVAGIQVVTSSGNRFDGDEVAQGRISRAILALNAVGGETRWRLADNTVVSVDADELLEALMLAGAEQTKIWME